MNGHGRRGKRAPDDYHGDACQCAACEDARETSRGCPYCGGLDHDYADCPQWGSIWEEEDL